MSGSLWYKHNPLDFLTGVVGLPPEQIGAYIVIINLIYARGGPIPDDARWLSGHMGCSTRLARTLVDALEKRGRVAIRDGVIIDDRALAEIRRSAETAAETAKNGGKGGRKRAEKARAEAKASGASHEGFADFSSSRTERKVGETLRKVGENDPDLPENSQLGQAGLKPNRIEEKRIESPREREADERPKQALDANGRLIDPDRPPVVIPDTPEGDVAREVIRIAGFATTPRDVGLVKQWMDAGANPEIDIYPVIEKSTRWARERGDPPSSLRFFDKSVRGQLAATVAKVDADIARWAADDKRLADMEAERLASERVEAEREVRRKAAREAHAAILAQQGSIH